MPLEPSWEEPVGRGRDGFVASLIASILPESHKGPRLEVRLGAGATAHLSSLSEILRIHKNHSIWIADRNEQT